MLPVPTFLRLIRAETLKELFEETPRGVSSAFDAEGVYLLRLVGGRWRVVGAYGVGEKALGLRLPLEWVPPEGPIPPPGPLAFSPDGRERPGYGLKRGDFALLLEGVSSLDPDGEELLTALLEVVILRAQKLVSLQILDFILAFGKRLRMGGSLERELKEALTELLAHTGFGAGALFLREGEICRLLVVGGEFPPEYLLYHQRHSVGCREGAGRLLWESPDGVAVIPDYQEYPHALPEVKRMGLRTTVQLLLSWAGQPYGVLALGSFGQKVEMEPELKRLLLVARDELEAYLERRLQLEGTLEAIAAILERLDYETEGHMRRVSELAVLLGERVGVEDLEGLRMGAYLHDLGKLFIPREILGKEAPLVTREWRVVKTHPEAGHEVLSRIPFLPKTALEVVLHHHEHWDGTGYPSGLKGEAIPLAARVFAVVDVWDALRSARPYKPAYPEEEAMKELLAMAGRKLDPRLVELFVSLVREKVLAGKEAWR